MKLTSMNASVRGVVAELIVELDGIHFEAVRLGIGSDAAEVAQRLHALAARIEHRATAIPVNEGKAGDDGGKGADHAQPKMRRRLTSDGNGGMCIVTEHDPDGVQACDGGKR